MKRKIDPIELLYTALPVIAIIAIVITFIAMACEQQPTYAPDCRCTIVYVEPQLTELEKIVLDGRADQLSTECVLETR